MFKSTMFLMIFEKFGVQSRILISNLELRIHNFEFRIQKKFPDPAKSKKNCNKKVNLLVHCLISCLHSTT
jgi:hypothetical protein